VKKSAQNQQAPSGDGGPAKSVKRCPICNRPASGDTLPFCSPRCRDVDLNRWLKGSYVIPGKDDEEDTE
jgi:endogenous inhibitor of DNA gyrase (YacG/DUF329 family)